VGFTLGQMYLLGHRRALGWPVGMVACALWIAWASELGLWSIVAINALLALLAARGWYRWTRRGQAAALGPGGPLLPTALGSVPGRGAEGDGAGVDPAAGDR
jgi:hypothetical protein